MDFSNFLLMHQEAGVMLIFLALLVYDIFASDRQKEWYRLVACLLFGIHTIIGFFPAETGTSFGGMYVSTDMTILMKNILNLGTLFVFMQSGQWLRTPETIQKQGEFYVITLATLLGMYLMISAGNFMLLYIGLETASLPLACLVAFNKYREKSAEAGAKYILISALSSGIMMFGLSYLYGAMGTMYFTDMSSRVMMEPMTIMGLVFFFAGLAFKISLVPFHLWTADVYEGAPTGVTAYLSVVSKAAASFVLIFTLWHVFGNIEVVWHHILWGLAVVTIVVGNLFAIRQRDIKRFFAFSSISQAGYILLGVMSGTAQGLSATVYFILVYLFSNLAAFGVITAMENASGRTDIASFNGFYKSNPKLSFVMMIAVFSLAGIPPFAGFFSKFFIFAAAASKGEYVLVFIALLNTVISLYYYLLIVKAMFINPADEQAVGRIQTDSYNRLSLLLCSAGIIGIGLCSGVYGYIVAVG
ncbi:NADH-quinone oxidoreductase subunit N [Odoribacter sp. OttesenSCG-928-J03]|nr:NADH-quinone oxidoreductase subunit N [Odoribacter sp. OttesenSCG-928-J03]MDL2282970.1 NADH-quinone oxidoreductase subunit N [Odoribacter sp. OttesenSCG-928-G04]